MSFISYAQNFEDVMLWRALKHIKTGFYIDVGANDPTIDSVTKAFYDMGWRGINIEPITEWYEKLIQDRPRDINLQCAAGAIEESELEMYELAGTGLSTIKKDIADIHVESENYEKKTIIVNANTLTSICNQYHIGPIHFLKIDVEGAEEEVIRGIDLNSIRPWIILVESTIPNTQTEQFESWQSYLITNGYLFTYFDGLNRFYIAEEHTELVRSFSCPPNYFDFFLLSGTASNSFSNYLNAQLKKLEEECVDLTESLTKKDYLLTIEEDKNEKLILELNDINENIKEAMDDSSNYTTEIERLERSLITKEAKVSDLEKQAININAELQSIKEKREELERELLIVYQSKSWHITGPLREFNLFQSRIILVVTNFISRILQIIKRIAKWNVLQLISIINKYSNIKKFSIRAISMFPRLEHRLRLFVSANISYIHMDAISMAGIESDENEMDGKGFSKIANINNDLEECSELSDLPRSVREIYRMLRSNYV